MRRRFLSGPAQVGVAGGLAICAMMFVLVGLGSPERAWHLISFIGSLNWPTSTLAWDVVVLNGYCR